MYDTIKMWLPSELINDSRYLQRVPTILKDVKSHYDNKTNNYYETGNLENLFVTISERGIGVTGSLNKYFHNDNLNKLNRQQTELSINKLSNATNLDFKYAKVKKIDLAHNLLMNEKASSYYYLLGNCQHYKRLVQENSIYYSNGLRTLLFYDKIDESSSLKMPEIWANKNVLRYELRYTSRVAKQLNINEITAQTLYKETFYIALIDNWINEYKLIKKNKLLTPNSTNMTNRDAKEYLLSALIDIVGTNEVMQIAEQWKNKFTTNKEAQRFKSSLRDLKGLTQQSDLINELDKKISRVAEYYR